MKKNKKTKREMPWDQYKTNWLNELSDANYLNQCGCDWCRRLKHHTTVLMNYLTAAWSLKAFDDKCDWPELQEGVELYTDYFHSKLSCAIIINVCESIHATLNYWNPDGACYYSWHGLIKYNG